MKTFFTSDQHYGHRRICELADRPFSSVEEMNETFIANHNNVVSSKDTIWMLGDFSFMDETATRSLLLRLNGQKHLVLGNHDKRLISHPERFMDYGMFKSIQTYKEISIQKQKIMLFHYGARVWNKSHHGSWLLYGHSHGSLPPYGLSVDVGVDDTNISDEYRPYEFGEIERFMRSREIEIADHHEKRG